MCFQLLWCSFWLDRPASTASSIVWTSAASVVFLGNTLCVALGKYIAWNIPSGKLTQLLKMAIYSWFTHQKLWISIVMLVYQRVHVACKKKAHQTWILMSKSSNPSSHELRQEGCILNTSGPIHGQWQWGKGRHRHGRRQRHHHHHHTSNEVSTLPLFHESPFAVSNCLIICGFVKAREIHGLNPPSSVIKHVLEPPSLYLWLHFPLIL